MQGPGSAKGMQRVGEVICGTHKMVAAQRAVAWCSGCSKRVLEGGERAGMGVWSREERARGRAF
eukprot:366000-Chlamydomonas_euryale.AAC.67